MADKDKHEKHEAPRQEILRQEAARPNLPMREPPPTPSRELPQPQPTENAEVTPMSGEQIATPPTSPPFINTLLCQITLGPWAGMALHLPNADAIQAIADKWAVDLVQAPFDPDSAPPIILSEADYNAAIAAAEAYAYSHVNPATDPDAPEGQRRAGRDRGHA